MSNRQDDALWSLVEQYADEVHDYNQAVRIDVDVDKAGAKCLAAEKALREAIASLQARLDAAEKDAALWRKWFPYLSRLQRKPFELARDADEAVKRAANEAERGA